MLGFGWSVYFINSIQQPKATVVIDPKKTFSDLEPGQSTHSDIIATLGAPERAYEEKEYTVLAYPSSTSYYMPDLLFVKNERLQMKELHYSPRQFIFTKDKLIQQQGSPDKTLFMPGNAYVDYEVYIYEKAGIAAYLDSSKQVFKIRYFKPSSADDYISQWDTTLLKTKSTPQLEKHQ